ncbi:MAG: hypothetical protein K6347_01645 [Campylobacterales bacterium]
MRAWLYLLIVALLIAGCSSKSYYKPESIEGTLRSQGSAPKQTTSDLGRIVGKSERGALIATPQGELLIPEGNGSVQTIALGFPVVTATLSNHLVVALTAQNRLLIYDLKAKRIVMDHPFEKAIAVDHRIVPPLVDQESAIVGTLDGKVAVVDLEAMKVVRDVVVSHQQFFNNVIFLRQIGDRLIAATAYRIISLTPKFLSSYEGEIRQVALDREFLYVALRDGAIVKLNLDLSPVDETKLPFAHIVALKAAGSVWSAEQQGYVIRFEEGNLSKVKVWQLDESLDDGAVFEDHQLVGAGGIYPLP